MNTKATTPSLAASITAAVDRRLRSVFNGHATAAATLTDTTITVTATYPDGHTYTATFPAENGVVPIFKASSTGITAAAHRP